MEFSRLPYGRALIADPARFHRVLKLRLDDGCEPSVIADWMCRISRLTNHSDLEEVKAEEAIRMAARSLHDTSDYSLPEAMLRFPDYRNAPGIRDIRRFNDEASSSNDYDETREWLIERYDLIHCEDCGELEYVDESTNVRDGDVICRFCRGNYILTDVENEYVSTDDVCYGLDAYGNEVSFISGNDDFEWSDERDTYVHVDYEPPVLGDYHDSKDRQEPIEDKWTATYGRFMGVELEVECEDADRRSTVNNLHEHINDGDLGKRVFFERDGSLRNGFEIITQPMSLPMIKDTFGFLNNSRLINGLKSHNTDTCGLHIHVSRKGMSSLQIAKLVCFINDPSNEWLVRAIARRYANGYCKIQQKRLGQAHMSVERYEAVNLTNRRTIEFRIFKGSLKYDAVIAAAEFVHALVEFTRPAESSLSALNSAGFLNFVQKKMPKECATFLRYLGERAKSEMSRVAA